MTVELHIPSLVYAELKRHLLPYSQKNEEAAFIFAQADYSEDTMRLTFKELRKLGPDDYQTQLPYHFELADKTRASVIKRAHELGSSIIEFHSHLDSEFTQFSVTDWQGFHEFVPHIFWRLQKRPYGAIVVTKKGFDALVWATDPEKPEALKSLTIGGQLLVPTNRSINEYYNERK